jgi:hypothetical protein
MRTVHAVHSKTCYHGEKIDGSVAETSLVSFYCM